MLLMKMTSWPSYNDSPPKLPPLPTSTNPDTLAAILYTSGSTGRPKGVMLSHANLALGAVSVAQYLGLQPDDKTLAVLPLSFDYGQNQLLSTWRAGGCVVPLDYLTPRDVIKACDKHKITTLAAVPPLWVQLAEQDWPATAVENMRRLTNSGGALTPSLVKMLRSIFCSKTRIFAMYGLTEAFRSTYLDPALIDANPTSMGKGIPFAEIMVVAPDGSEAAPDEPGELVHAGPLVAQGYWQDEARTAERFKPAPAFSKYGGHSRLVRRHRPPRRRRPPLFRRPRRRDDQNQRQPGQPHRNRRSRRRKRASSRSLRARSQRRTAGRGDCAVRAGERR